MMTEEEKAFFQQQKSEAKLKKEKQNLIALPPSFRACIKCHQHQLTNFSPQRRSSDEPCATTFICNNTFCRATWTENEMWGQVEDDVFVEEELTNTIENKTSFKKEYVVYFLALALLFYFLYLLLHDVVYHYARINLLQAQSHTLTGTQSSSKDNIFSAVHEWEQLVRG